MRSARIGMVKRKLTQDNQYEAEVPVGLSLIRKDASPNLRIRRPRDHSVDES